MLFHSHLQLYALLTDWYGRLIFCHLNVEIGAVVLPVSHGGRCPSRGYCDCCGFFMFGVYVASLPPAQTVWNHFPHVVSCAHCLWFWDGYFPMFIGAFGTVVNLLESHFGHDRAKNDSEFVFPVLSCNCCLISSVQWLVFRLCRENGLGAWFA